MPAACGQLNLSAGGTRRMRLYIQQCTTLLSFGIGFRFRWHSLAFAPGATQTHGEQYVCLFLGCPIHTKTQCRPARPLGTGTGSSIGQGADVADTPSTVQPTCAPCSYTVGLLCRHSSSPWGGVIMEVYCVNPPVL